MILQFMLIFKRTADQIVLMELLLALLALAVQRFLDFSSSTSI